MSYRNYQLESALSGLDTRIDIETSGLLLRQKQLEGDGRPDVEVLGAWWNPVDWGKGAWDTMQSVNETAEVCKQIYDQLRQLYGQGQAVFMEISTFWRGIVNNATDLEARIKQLTNERGQKSASYDKIIAAQKDAGAKKVWTSRKNNDLKAYDSQIAAYKHTIENVKKMFAGLWGPQSPFGKFGAMVTSGIKDVGKGFETFQKDVQKQFAAFQKMIEGYAKELAKITGQVQVGIKDVSKWSESTFNSVKQQLDVLNKSFAVHQANLVKMGEGFKNVQDTFKVQLITLNQSFNTGFQNINKTFTGGFNSINKTFSDGFRNFPDLVASQKGLIDIQKGQIIEMKAANEEAIKFYRSGMEFFERATAHLKSIDEKISLPKFGG